MLGVIGWSLAISLIVNGLMFLIAFRFKSDKLTDASYALSFIALAAFAFVWSNGNAYTAVLAGMVCLWALRIGSFLLYRVLQTGKDRRFDGIRGDFWKFGKFWLGQALTVWVLMIPVSLVSAGDRVWQNVAYVGLAIWFIGGIIEALADVQKYRFTHDPAHKGQWIEDGVWRYSRHPNYFGEILVWIGVYFCALPGLTEYGKLIGVVSPLCITLLLLFVSGVPILERSADSRWGDQPKYQAYKRRTSLLLLLPNKGGRRLSEPR